MPENVLYTSLCNVIQNLTTVQSGGYGDGQTYRWSGTEVGVESVPLPGRYEGHITSRVGQLSHQFFWMNLISWIYLGP